MSLFFLSFLFFSWPRWFYWLFWGFLKNTVSFLFCLIFLAFSFSFFFVYHFFFLSDAVGPVAISTQLTLPFTSNPNVSDVRLKVFCFFTDYERHFFPGCMMYVWCDGHVVCVFLGLQGLRDGIIPFPWCLVLVLFVYFFRRGPRAAADSGGRAAGNVRTRHA